MAVQAGKRWGQWSYNKDDLTLEFIFREPEKRGDVAYYVDLERCGTADEILDWIVQVAQKGWIQPEDIGHLVRGLDELSDYEIQGSIVHSDKPFDWKSALLGPSG